MKLVRRGGGGCRSSMLRRSVREFAAAAIGAQENTKRYTSRRGARRRCPARKGLRCCGRGETARDSVFTEEPFRTATIEKAVPGFPVPYAILPSPGFEAPARFVGNYGAGRWSEDGEHPQGRSIDRLGGGSSPVKLLRAGGSGDRRSKAEDRVFFCIIDYIDCLAKHNR